MASLSIEPSPVMIERHPFDYDLDARFPGLKFRVVDEQDRVRKHMRLFVGQSETRDVTRALEPADELLIFGALSGG